MEAEMINVTHQTSDSEAWSVKYVLMRLPQTIRITPSSYSSIREAVISDQTHRNQPLNARWVFGGPQCQIFTELQAETAAGTLLAFFAEPLVRIDSNDSADRRYEERCTEERRADKRRGKERRRNALAIIKEFIDRSLALESLDAALIGRQFGMSRSSVYRLFESEGGLANYIRRRRLMQAFSLLVLPPITGGLRILDVAVECGFSSDTVFTRAFRKMFSLTPSMVRSMGELQTLELNDLLAGLSHFVFPDQAKS